MILLRALAFVLIVVPSVLIEATVVTALEATLGAILLVVLAGVGLFLLLRRFYRNGMKLKKVRFLGILIRSYIWQYQQKWSKKDSKLSIYR